MNNAAREPNFLIVGAAKAGTTSLAAYLAQHPAVYIPPEKELHFFDRDQVYAKGWAWYTGRFAAAGDALALGEATPTYMAHERVALRMARHLPDVRLISILRNPIDRAYSYYWHLRAFGAERRSFEESLADPETERRVGYLARGRYAEQIRVLHRYYPADKLHVALFDDLVSDPARTFSDVCRWLGVDPTVPVALGQNFNPRFRLRSPMILRLTDRTRLWRRWPALAHGLLRLNRVPISTEPMNARTRTRLIEEFAPANAELAALIGRDLSAWNR